MTGKYTKRYVFRAEPYEAAIIEEMAKIFEHKGIPNYSAAIRFFIDFFIAFSFVDPDKGKEITEVLYDSYLRKINPTLRNKKRQGISRNK